MNQRRRGLLSLIPPVLRVVSLLIGLPAVLQSMLWLTESRFGLWPSLLATSVVGAVLSIVYTSERSNEKLVDAGGQAIRDAGRRHHS